MIPSMRDVLYRSMRGRGEIMFFETFVLLDPVKSEGMQLGVSLLDTLNIITALLCFSCFVNGRNL